MWPKSDGTENEEAADVRYRRESGQLSTAQCLIEKVCRVSVC